MSTSTCLPCVHVAIGLGASGAGAGNRVALAATALANLPHTAVVGRSQLHQTQAISDLTLQFFANAAVVVDTSLSLAALFRSLRGLEHRFGRVRTTTNASRSLDLDVLWLWGVHASTVEQNIPHPRLWQRAFAHMPLAEAATAAGLPLPMSQTRTQIWPRATTTPLVPMGGLRAQ